MLYCVNLFYEMKVEAVALVYIVMLLCKTGKYSVMLWKFTGRINKHLEDSLMYSRMNTIK